MRALAGADPELRSKGGSRRVIAACGHRGGVAVTRPELCILAAGRNRPAASNEKSQAAVECLLPGAALRMKRAAPIEVEIDRTVAVASNVQSWLHDSSLVGVDQMSAT